jgi:hypothetical protein
MNVVLHTADLVHEDLLVMANAGEIGPTFSAVFPWE